MKCSSCVCAFQKGWQRNDYTVLQSDLVWSGMLLAHSTVYWWNGSSRLLLHSRVFARKPGDGFRDDQHNGLVHTPHTSWEAVMYFLMQFTQNNTKHSVLRYTEFWSDGTEDSSYPKAKNDFHYSPQAREQESLY